MKVKQIAWNSNQQWESNSAGSAYMQKQGTPRRRELSETVAAEIKARPVFQNRKSY